MRATFNICSGWFGPDDGSNPPGSVHRKLSRREALDVYAPDVCEVACHGVHHEFLTACDVTAGCIDVIDFLELQPKYDPKLFYVWGHSYEFNDQNNWHVIEDFAEKMANKDDIWYATNIELYYAWLDYSRLESSADGSMIHNPSVRSVWIGDKKGNSYEIKPGQTITLP